MKTMDSLQAEIAHLHALLAQIEEPVAPSETTGDLSCLWCFGCEVVGFSGNPDKIDHDGDCLWLAIRRERQP